MEGNRRVATLPLPRGRGFEETGYANAIGSTMRVAFLWTGLSGYMNACLKELAAREGVELFVSHELPDKEAPYDEEQFKWIQSRLAWRSQDDLESLDTKLQDFRPEIMVMPSWHVPAYRRVAKKFANRCWRVMVMDNPWRGSLKQRLGTLVSSIYVKPITDVVWLPGERQSSFARRLGFSQSSILRGSFTCDHPAFEAMHKARLAQGRPVPRSFVFIGRMVKAKSVDKLAEAYRIYREINPNPWPLICCGSGPLQSCLENENGIRVEGFVQPDKIPEVLSAAGCLILPSRFEPWALVVHEAAAAGKVILASENVGAVTHLVQPGYNGFIFNNEDVVELAGLMSRVSAMTDTELDRMSDASYLLSLQFSPRQWADTLLRSPHPPTVISK
jgi:glycosyltransferase involved in cell wall biosynthesis